MLLCNETYFRMKLASFLFAINSAKLSPFHDDIIYNIDFVGEKADLNIPGSDRPLVMDERHKIQIIIDRKSRDINREHNSHCP